MSKTKYFGLDQFAERDITSPLQEAAIKKQLKKCRLIYDERAPYPSGPLKNTKRKAGRDG